jgi:hypothetical protein
MRPVPFAALLLSLCPAALAEVHLLRATLNDPAGVSAGLGEVEVTVNDQTGQVTLHGHYGGLTGDVVGAHLHDPAILIPLQHAGGTAGELFGEQVLGPADVATILAGGTWVNVHTTANPVGEIRGDVLYPRETIPCFGNGSQNVPATASGGYVSGGVLIDRTSGQVSVQVPYGNLTFPVTGALLGRGDRGANGPTLLQLSWTGAQAGVLTGTGQLTPDEARDVADGFSYVQILTSGYPLGEVRGQVRTAFLGRRYCEAAPTSLGFGGFLIGVGDAVASRNDATLQAFDLPTNQFGFFLVGAGSGQVFPLTGSSGRLCLSGAPLARFAPPVMNTGPFGRLDLALDLTSLPFSPQVAVQPGDTWNFQAWFRDTPATSNFTNAITITFR